TRSRKCRPARRLKRYRKTGPAPIARRRNTNSWWRSMPDEALLENAFRRIHATRMAGIPILNPSLQVETHGFRDWNGMRVGVLITPWSINLAVLREANSAVPALRLDERRAWVFPSGRYE